MPPLPCPTPGPSLPLPGLCPFPSLYPHCSCPFTTLSLPCLCPLTAPSLHCPCPLTASGLPPAPVPMEDGRVSVGPGSLPAGTEPSAAARALWPGSAEGQSVPVRLCPTECNITCESVPDVWVGFSLNAKINFCFHRVFHRVRNCQHREHIDLLERVWKRPSR